MSESNRNGRSRKDRRNESGSIEGLPLQLMIMGITTPDLTLISSQWSKPVCFLP
jgi:hypothetical protein